jgi:hypothetical protein
MDVYEDFTTPLSKRWQRFIKGTGKLEPTGSTLRFAHVDASSEQYSNAQIDDYQGLPRRRFPWRPPLKLTVQARFSHSRGNGITGLKGTAGFGFWNDPFLMTGARSPSLPRAIWFFHASPPSDMKLDLEVPGYGWKAATIAPLATLAMNIPPLYRLLWPPIQRAINLREAVVEADMADWHTYDIEWGRERANFRVDGKMVLKDAPAPRGPLGFVMWLDNQYMVVTPWGRLGWGVLDAPGRQWMEIDWFTIEQPLYQHGRSGQL